MKKDFEKLRTICKSINIPEGRMTDEMLFTIYSVDLFYYKKNIGTLDIKSGFVDGGYDGGIDFIYSDTEKMYLIQGKSSNNLSFEDIKNVFYKMSDTVMHFDERKYDQYSDLLKSAYLNAYDNLNDDKNIEFVLFTKTNINEELRKKISEFEQSFNNYSINVFDINDIDNREAINYQNSDLIDEDYIDIFLNDDKFTNMLSYGENGIIVNVKASTVKRLYDKYGKTGLFSFNLREHISQKNVDDGIEATIKKEKEKFWFYNNGITIGCDDYYRDGNRIKLYKFSIINGAQTTTKIGKSKLINEKNDFALVCKIVRAKNSVRKDEDFISKISEASNSQKPIKQRDLKANAVEQKKLQRVCAENGKYSLAIEIKRGVKPHNYKKVDKWQRVTNEYIGQLIYACIFQKPGPARNSKNTMFSSGKVYKMLFGRTQDPNTLYDLVRIGNSYDEFVAKYVERINDLDKIAIAKNGKLAVLAILIYLCKQVKGIVKDSESEELRKDNLTGFLVSDYSRDDLDIKLESLFEFIIRQLNIMYDSKKVSMKITSYSNFFKSEQIYEFVLKEFDGLDSYDKNKLKDFLEVFVLKN